MTALESVQIRKQCQRGFYGSLLTHATNAAGTLYDILLEARDNCPGPAFAPEDRAKLDLFLQQLGDQISWLEKNRP